MTVSPLASPALGATSAALPPVTPQTKSKYEYLCLDLTRAYCREAVSDQSTCLSVIAKVALLAFPLIAILAALEAVFDLVIAAPITFIANCIAGPQEITPDGSDICGIPNPEEDARVESFNREYNYNRASCGIPNPKELAEEVERLQEERERFESFNRAYNRTYQESAAPTVTETAEQPVVNTPVLPNAQPNEETQVQVGQGQATQTTTTEQSDEEPQTPVDQGQAAPTVNTTNVITPSDTSGPKVLKAAQTKNPTPRQALNSKKGKNKGKSQNLLQAEQRAAKAEAEKKEAQIKLRAKIAASAEARRSKK